MPVLDLKIWIEKGILRHIFYKKPMAHPMTVLYRSAVSMGCKRTTVFNEILRRMNNCDSNQPWETVRNVLTEFMNTLRLSGYPEHFRYNILKGALQRHNECQDKANKGEWVRYRSSETIREQILHSGRFI